MKHPIRNSIIGLVVVVGIISISVCTYPVFFGSIDERADFLSDKISNKLDLTKVQNEKLSSLKVYLVNVVKTLKNDKKQHHKDVLQIIAVVAFHPNLIF